MASQEVGGHASWALDTSEEYVVQCCHQISLEFVLFLFQLLESQYIPNYLELWSSPPVLAGWRGGT